VRTMNNHEPNLLVDSKLHHVGGVLLREMEGQSLLLGGTSFVRSQLVTSHYKDK
jgi:hypothetical protein